MRKPIAHRLVVKLTVPDELKAYEMIEVPQQQKDFIMYSHTEGEVVAIGPKAFAEESIFGDVIPKVGDKVCIVKNSGIQYKEKATGLSVVKSKGAKVVEEKSQDYNYFRVINDLDVYAVVE